MFSEKKIGLVVLVMAVGLMGLSQQALADGTASGTTISNTVLLDYTVGGVGQDQLSDTTDFVVDNKIDLTVALIDVAAVSVVPGSTNQVMTFSVTNDGNTLQDYSLAATPSAGTVFSLTHDFDASNVRIFVDNGDNVFNAADDTRTYIDELAADATVRVYVLADFPLSGIADGDASLYDLAAQTAVGGVVDTQGTDIVTDDSANAWTAGTVQIVFTDAAGEIDAANDGVHSTVGAYLVASATMSVTKSSLVVYDPINGNYVAGSVFPKAIPGARVQYTIDISNTGTTNANAVTVVDEIPENSYFVVGTLATTQPGGTVVTLDYANDEPPTWGYIPVDGGDGSDHTVTYVRAVYDPVASAASVQAVFEVLIP